MSKTSKRQVQLQKMLDDHHGEHLQQLQQQQSQLQQQQSQLQQLQQQLEQLEQQRQQTEQQTEQKNAQRYAEQQKETEKERYEQKAINTQLAARAEELEERQDISDGAVAELREQMSKMLLRAKDDAESLQERVAVLERAKDHIEQRMGSENTAELKEEMQRLAGELEIVLSSKSSIAGHEMQNKVLLERVQKLTTHQRQ